MKTYEQVLEKVELALAKGEYHYCIEFLLPIIESFPLSSKEGVNLRTILITALCGINKKEEASSFLLIPHRAVIKIVLKFTPSLLDKGNDSIMGKRNSMQ